MRINIINQMPVPHPSTAESPSCCAAEGPAGGVATGAPPAAACSNSAQPCFLWQSAELLQGHKRVHIAHNGGVYQLQATRQGKLILTK